MPRRRIADRAANPTHGGRRRMKRQTTAWGAVYRRPNSRYWWLKVKFPGDPTPHRQPTNPRTEDEQEARRQLHERLGERGHVRAQRPRTETVPVHDLLDLYVLDCADKGPHPTRTGRALAHRARPRARARCLPPRPR